MANSFVGTWKTDFEAQNDEKGKPTGSCMVTVSQYTRTPTAGTILIGMYEAASAKEYPGVMLGSISQGRGDLVWKGKLQGPSASEQGEFKLTLNSDGKGFTGTYTRSGDPTTGKSWTGTLALAHVKPQPSVTSTGSKK